MTTADHSTGTDQAVGIGDQIRQDIDSTLETRHAAPGSQMRDIEDRAKTVGKRVWVLLQKHPYTGVAVTAALGIVAASTFGVGELAVGLGLGYAVYNVLKGRETPEQAIQQMVREVEHV